MPDISKINALAIGSVSKVDGLAKASILDIDGVAVPSAVSPPLDTFTNATIAYSVRLLRTAYTGDIMRVRRASDNVEADVGFDSNDELSLTSPISNTSDAQSYTDFADFVDHTGTPTDAFVRYWYDQSGNTQDAGQATSTIQPQIYDASAGFFEGGTAGNEKPAMNFTDAAAASAERLNMGAIAAVGSNFMAVSVATSRTTSSGVDWIFNRATNYSSIGMTAYFTGAVPGGWAGFAGSTGAKIASSSELNNQILHVVQADTGTLDLYVDSVQATTTAAWQPYDSNYIGARRDGNQPMNGTIQEIFMFDDNRSSVRTDIEDNVAAYFTITL